MYLLELVLIERAKPKDIPRDLEPAPGVTTGAGARSSPYSLQLGQLADPSGHSSRPECNLCGRGRGTCC